MTMIECMKEWHRVVSERDAEALDSLLADDVVFHSPIVFSPQHGKALTTLYLTGAMHTLANPSFRYVREVVGNQDAILEFEAEVDGLYVNGVDMIRWNDQGRIIDFKVMLRPLKAINLMHRKMAEMLESLRG